MMNWLRGLSLRERLIVAALALVGLFVLLDLLVIQPYSQYRAGLVEDLEQARMDLDWMQQAVSQLSGKTSVSTPGIRGNIATYVDGQITRAGLKKQLQQMTPIQRDSVRVRLSDVEFNRLMQFFAGLNPGIDVDEIRILPTAVTGQVDISMVLRNTQANT